MEHNAKIRLQSKKNQVYLELMKVQNAKGNGLDDALVVRKVFAAKQGFLRECEIMEILENAQVRTPKIKKIVADTQIIYEYIQGENAIDLIEQLSFSQNEEQAYQLLEKIADWIFLFHKTIFAAKGEQWILGDAHLRNFLYDGDVIYGIDFEDCRPGIVETDIARMIVFLLHYDLPCKQIKEKLAENFELAAKSVMPLNTLLLEQEKEKERIEMKKRRKR